MITAALVIDGAWGVYRMGGKQTVAASTRGTHTYTHTLRMDFVQEGLIAELKEADLIQALCHVGPGLFAYTLSNCTVGMYSSLQRSWRVKSKHNVNSVCAHRHSGDGPEYLITGWNNGKVWFRLVRE